MSWLRKLFGRGRTKEVLIRDLVKNRLAGDTADARYGAAAVDSLPVDVIGGLPEASVVAIVEAWCQCKDQQMSDDRIFRLIDSHRSVVAVGNMPTISGLASFVKYRVHLEHVTGSHISDKHIEHCVAEARAFFGKAESSDEPAQVRQQSQTFRERLMNPSLDGQSSDHVAGLFRDIVVDPQRAPQEFTDVTGLAPQDDLKAYSDVVALLTYVVFLPLNKWPDQLAQAASQVYTNVLREIPLTPHVSFARLLQNEDHRALLPAVLAKSGWDDDAPVNEVVKVRTTLRTAVSAVLTLRRKTYDEVLARKLADGEESLLALSIFIAQDFLGRAVTPQQDREVVHNVNGWLIDVFGKLLSRPPQ